MKRIISLIIALSMLIALIPAQTAFAASGQDIVDYAYNTWQGTPWRSRGSVTYAPKVGIDCSYLVYDAYAHFGYSVGKNTTEQRYAGVAVDHSGLKYNHDYSNLKPGDIILFRSGGVDYGHVGIYAGNDEFIHAATSGVRKQVLYGDGYNWNQYTNEVRRIINAPEPHTHSWSYGNDSSHPHKQYRTCSCGAKEYTGNTQRVSSCRSCYPVGNVSLTRSYSRTSKDVTLYRNNVSNANEYTLTLYRNGSQYGTYDMVSTSKNITGLASGTYYATLTAKNTNTGETRNALCDTFTLVDTYAVTYDANGGENAPSAQAKIKDEDMTITSSAPQRTGYIFKGWAPNKIATEPQYQSGGTYTKNTPITLYAVWEPEIYTIDFDVNGGRGDAASTTITYGNTMKMPNTVIKEGSYLKGWSQTKGASTPDYKLGMDYKLTANMTLYAVWGQSTWGGTVANGFAGGDGTEENPYQISNAAELAHLADIVNNQQSAPEYKYYILTDNINLGYEEWIPIGLYGNENQYFCGSFDGNGYTISDLNITNINEGYVGLFGYAKDGEIKNLTVSGDITGITSDIAIYMGSIIGYADNTNIDNCNISYINISDIATDNSIIGGICGELRGDINNCTATECYVGIKESETLALGMICGEVVGNISNCEVKSTEELFGTITKLQYTFLGGICGIIIGNHKLENCSVTAGFLCGDIISGSQNIYAGGIVGYAGNETDAITINSCSVRFLYGREKMLKNQSYKVSIFTSSQENVFVGGISGRGGQISNCMYDGQSIVAEATVTVTVGGISGRDATANKCFSNVDGILYSSGGSFVQAGGILGINQVSNSIAIADGIYADGHSYYVYGGDITGNSSINCNNVHSNSNMEVSVINTNDSSHAYTNIIGSKRPLTQIKRASFLNQVYGPAYQSVEYLEENPEAVWVIKDGEYPELYFNVLHDITLSDVENGTISVDKTQAIDGEIVTVTAVPAENYLLNKIYVNGNEIVGNTFEVDGDSDVYATFSEKTAEYSVRVQATDNASASLVNTDAVTPYSVSLFASSDSISAADGEEIKVNAVANEDYTVDAVYVNGEEMASDSFIVTDDSVVTMDVKSISTDIEATTYDAVNIVYNGATLGGSVEDIEGVSRYIRYWKADTPDEVYTTEVQEGGGEYSVTVTDLETYELYQYQMTESGEIKSFMPEYVPVDDSDINIPEPCFTVDIQDTYAEVTNTGEEQTVTVIIAEYDADGMLTNVSAEEVLFAESEIKRFDVPLDGKIFIWNSLLGMIPMTK